MSKVSIDLKWSDFPSDSSRVLFASIVGAAGELHYAKIENPERHLDDAIRTILGWDRDEDEIVVRALVAAGYPSMAAEWSNRIGR